MIRSTLPAAAMLAGACCTGASMAGSIYDDYRALTPTSGVAVEGKTATIGHLNLTFTSGTIYPLRSATGTVSGLYFQGTGGYSYQTEDPQDLQTFAHNLKSASRVLDGTNSTVRDDVKSMAILFGQAALESFWSSAPSGEAAPPGVAQAWRAYEKQMALSDIGFDHRALEARFNGDDKQVIYAEFEGARERAGYLLDHARFGGESFFLFYHPPGIDFRFFKLVSHQEAPEERRRAAEILLEKADFDVNTPDNRAGSITSQLSLRLQRAGLRVLSFGLINSRDPGSARWDSPKHALQVMRVVDGTGRELPFSHRYNELSVDLGAPQPADTRVELRFETQGDIFTEPDGERNNQYVTLYEIDWYPTLLGVTQERFTFHLRVRCKKPYLPVTSGDRLSLQEDGDFYVLESASTIPAEDIAVYLGKYTPHEVQRGPHTVRLYSYGLTRDVEVEKLLKFAGEVLEFFDKFLGPYPFKELELVELPTYRDFYGISPVGIALLTSATYKTDVGRLRNSSTGRSSGALVSHEIAHQWFGHQVIPRSVYDTWLSEGFAEYWGGVALGTPKDPRVKGFPQLLADWRGYGKFSDNAGSVESANLVAGDLGSDYRYYLLYCRAPLILHMLRTLVGDEKFLQISRGLLAAGKRDTLSTADVANVASKVAATDLHWFFEQWIREAGTPTIKVDKQVVADGSGVALVGKLQQAVTGFKKIHVPFVITLPDGSRAVKLVFQEQPVQEFRVPLDVKPKSVDIDPAQNNLAYYK